MVASRRESEAHSDPPIEVSLPGQWGPMLRSMCGGPVRDIIACMEITNVKVVDHHTGLVTQGMTPEMDSECGVIHQNFLETHHLTYWQLVILPIFATTYVLVFSCPPGAEEKPNYILTNISDLVAEISEMLALHHQQWSSGKIHSHE